MPADKILMVLDLAVSLVSNCIVPVAEARPERRAKIISETPPAIFMALMLTRVGSTYSLFEGSAALYEEPAKRTVRSASKCTP